MEDSWERGPLEDSSEQLLSEKKRDIPEHLGVRSLEESLEA